MNGQFTDAQVIIVGSGPAGISAAWPLVRAGVNVLMIDASSNDASLAPRQESIASFRADPQRWHHRFGSDLSSLPTASDVSPKLSTPQARHTLAGFDAGLNLTTTNFLAAGSLGRGGLSKIWGALAATCNDDELASFPNGGTGLRASYRTVAKRIGITGGRGSDPDAVQHAPARNLLARYRSRGTASGVDLHPAPNAVITAARGDRDSCTRCGLCLFGCSRGSIYDAAQELPALQAFPNFQYRSGHLVRSMHSRDGEHVLHIDTDRGQVQLRAATVVLAAGTLATTNIALRRIRYVNRPVRLLSNPAAATAFIMPAYIGADLPRQTFGLGQLFYRTSGPDGAAGVVYGADTLPLDQIAARMPVGRPLALRLAHALAPALLMTTCYVPGALSENTLHVRDAGDGQTRMTIDGVQTPQAVAALQTALRSLKRTFLRLGALPLPGSTTILQPGADAHYAGTLPMGGGGPLGTSAYGELNECSGVFIADGASLPALPAVHPTLTIMANADRIGHEIARRIQASADAAGTMRGIAV